MAGRVCFIASLLLATLIATPDGRADGPPPPGRSAPAAAPATPEPVSALLAGASVRNGRRLAHQCARCHSFKKDAPRKVGPTLWGVVGANKGRDPGFPYSPGLTGKGGTWTYEELNAFLADPARYAPGTKMDFAGIGAVADRADVIVYLRSLANVAVALP